MFDDMMAGFNATLNMAANIINGAANTLMSTFSFDHTKELYTWTNEEAQKFMETNPIHSMRGLVNSGQNPAGAGGPGSLAGASSPVQSANQFKNPFPETLQAGTQSLLALDQLKTNEAQRDLIAAQADKEVAESDLLREQSQGQNLHNQDYSTSLINGGVLGQQVLSQALQNRITRNSIPVLDLRNELASKVLHNQINDPDIVQAIYRMPVWQQQQVISDFINNLAQAYSHYRQGDLFAEKIKTEQTQQGLNSSQIGLNDLLGKESKSRVGLNELLGKESGSRTGLNESQSKHYDALTKAMQDTNPYDMGHAIGDLNNAPWKKDFYRGLWNYFLNGLPSFVGAGVNATNNIRDNETRTHNNMRDNQTRRENNLRDNQIRRQNSIRNNQSRRSRNH